MLPAFVRGSGPFAADHALGAILGLTTQTRRGQMVRAAFEALCFQMRRQMEVIERIPREVHSSLNSQPPTPDAQPRSRCERLRVLGGGQRNNLWLQIKADVTGRPVEVLQHPEVTLMGVALLAGVGGGVYRDAREAVGSIEIPVTRLEPDREAQRRYEDAYGRFLGLAPALRSFHLEGQRSPKAAGSAGGKREQRMASTAGASDGRWRIVRQGLDNGPVNSLLPRRRACGVLGWGVYRTG